MGQLRRQMRRGGKSEQEQIVQTEKLRKRGNPILLNPGLLLPDLWKWRQGEKECELAEQTGE